LRTARISKIDAENDALILSAGDQEITASSLSLIRQGNLAVVGKNFVVLQSGLLMMSCFLA
jgi:hypothetical protein